MIAAFYSFAISSGSLFFCSADWAASENDSDKFLRMNNKFN